MSIIVDVNGMKSNMIKRTSRRAFVADLLSDLTLRADVVSARVVVRTKAKTRFLIKLSNNLSQSMFVSIRSKGVIRTSRVIRGEEVNYFPQQNHEPVIHRVLD